VINQTGDFLFIPAGITHMPVNLSASEAAIAIVARNDANEQEQVELHTPPGKAESAPGTPTCAAPGHKWLLEPAASGEMRRRLGGRWGKRRTGPSQCWQEQRRLLALFH
jgi:hypothetical protein